MGYASYFENIIERLSGTHASFRNEISSLRRTLGNADLTDRELVAHEIRAFKQRLTRFLDELDARSAKLFEEAKQRLSDKQVNLTAFMKKRDNQLAEARKGRDEAKRKFERTRELNIRLMAERDALSKQCEALRKQLDALVVENSKYKREIQDRREWIAATGDVKRR
jgi:chromosome segregation ATPase